MIEFIDGVKQRFKAINDLKVKLYPYIALVIIISELEQVTEIKNAIEIKTNKIKNIKDLVTEISITDYLKICTKINNKAKALGIDGGMGASAIKALKASRQLAPLLDRKKDKLINIPPLGKYAKKYIEE